MACRLDCEQRTSIAFRRSPSTFLKYDSSGLSAVRQVQDGHRSGMHKAGQQRTTQQMTQQMTSISAAIASLRSGDAVTASICNNYVHEGREYQLLYASARDAVIPYEDRTPTPSRERGERTAQRLAGHSRNESAFPISYAHGVLYR